ncbi:hypothetical protein JCM19047_452 [Bacillus sp. JCM 19047]|uniref:Uncharacterized protein n=1 Tax=Shouchella miscanthi TaxID=2598861 RepID=A0ABU6NJN6_9BACI|nr:hypothetical protein [Shouchella miscanthi]MED4128427.1 hypothetical protein [Shouchella miscanthi]GAF20795.1 hypothetical protein JCM19047_452 [Bacillus sp. JCM 19047]
MEEYHSTSKSEIWWRIEVIAWVPFFITMIVSFLLTFHFGLLDQTIFTTIALIRAITFIVALIPKTIKCYYLGLKRTYAYGSLALLLVLDLLYGIFFNPL